MNLDYSFKIKILFDNKCHESGFLTGFGFSALIYNNFTGNYLLFDTGGDGNILIHNIEQSRIKVSDIKKIIISHDHFDHSGGLREIFFRNPKIEIFVPFNEEKSYNKAYLNADIHAVLDSMLIEKNIHTSGQFGTTYIKEQALFLTNVDNEVIIIVGCSHPGLEKFILKAKELGDIKGIVGGFHGFKKFSYLKDVKIIAACHCSQYIREIKKRFPQQYKNICVGQEITF